MNTFSNDLGYSDISLNKQITVNDVVAVKSPLCKFMNEDVSPFSSTDAFLI